jgi:hypothetical protein
MLLSRKRSLLHTVLKSNYLTGLTVRKATMAAMVVLALTEVPALIRYLNVERM